MDLRVVAINANSKDIRIVMKNFQTQQREFNFTPRERMRFVWNYFHLPTYMLNPLFCFYLFSLCSTWDGVHVNYGWARLSIKEGFNHIQMQMLTSLDNTSSTENGCSWAKQPCRWTPYKFHTPSLFLCRFRTVSPFQIHPFCCTWHCRPLFASYLPILWCLFEVEEEKGRLPLWMRMSVN